MNAVSPGEIATSILSAGTEEMVEQQVPMKRLGSPAEVAEVVSFLCSAKASYVTGAEIPINGGSTSERAAPPSPYFPASPAAKSHRVSNAAMNRSSSMVIATRM